jgi:hypothetical protein
MRTYVLGLLSPTLAAGGESVMVMNNVRSEKPIKPTLSKSRNESVVTGHRVGLHQSCVRERAVRKVTIASSRRRTFVQVGSHALVVAADYRIVLPKTNFQQYFNSERSGGYVV